MKLDALKNYIKQAIRTELRSVLKEELRYQLSEIILGSDTPIRRLQNEHVDSSYAAVEDVPTSSPVPPKKFVKYTNNEVLNQLLNETTGGVPQEGSFAGLMGGGFDVPAGPEVLNETVVQPVQPTQPPEMATDAQKSVYKALTRDYRQLLRAVDKKRGG